MQEIQVHKISTETAWEILWKAWAMVKVNYWLCVGLVIFIWLLNILTQIPFFGPFLGGLVSITGALLGVRLAEALEKGNPSSFNEVMSVLDGNVFNHFIPLIILQTGLSFLLTFIFNLDTLILRWQLAFIVIGLSMTLTMAVPLMYYHKSIDIKKAISLTVEGLIKNIFTHIVLALLTIALIMICAMFLLLPFFFIAMPITLMVNYLWYRTVFDGLKLESKEEEPLI